MRTTLLATIAGTVLLAACASGGSAPSSAAPTEGPTAAPVRIEVTLSDAIRIEPAAMTVPAGVPVTFVVTNTGKVLHEFVLGDEEAQAEHEAEMQAMGGHSMVHDHPNAIGVDPGETKELTFTFEQPGTTYAGCHVTGHYDGGMKAEITVE